MRRTALLIVLALTACQGQAPAPPPAAEKKCPPPGEAKGPAAPGTPAAAAPTVAEAESWMKATEEALLKVWIKAERMNWVQANFITEDTNALVAGVDEEVMALVGAKAKEARRFDGLALSPELQRKLLLLRLAQSLPAPDDAKLRAELAKIAADLRAAYGTGKYCRTDRDRKCFDLGELSAILAKSRNPDELLEAWEGWHATATKMRQPYQRFAELGNAGALALGFKDLGELWRSNYDLTAAEFEKEVDRLWTQVKPLYDDLHCYVRGRLQGKYGKDRVKDGEPIPAHLLGNMWAQEWDNLWDLLAPEQGGELKIEAALKARKVDAVGLVKIAEAFFSSLGIPALPETFWKRSLFVQPKDREVVCHASAWDLDWEDDLRIKMCIKVNDEDFTTAHHELGHNYYQRAYKGQPALFRGSANDGFHEALGDTIALSVTPSYLVKLGLLPTEPPDNLNPLLLRALEKVAFLPFGLIVDKWRWGVFSGQIPPGRYNEGWWALRRQYQGVAPARPRDETFFDPGAKYHIPSNTPYSRYFLAAILQFQFHRALCKLIGHQGPLHRCSIYQSQEAGKRIQQMMAMGVSRPWPEALKALTGEDRMDASAILDYFRPLHEWLRKQNQGKTCGWK